MTESEWIAAAKVMLLSNNRLIRALPVGIEVEEADNWIDLCNAQMEAIKELVAIVPEPVTVAMEPLLNLNELHGRDLV